MEDELMAMSSNPFAEENDDLLLRLERLQRYRKSIEASFFRFRREWREVNQAIAEDAEHEKNLAEAEYSRALTEYLMAPPPLHKPQNAATPATENRRL